MKWRSGRFLSDSSWRERNLAVFLQFGLLAFLTSFFWAPSRDFMHAVYGLAFFAPAAIALLLRRPGLREYGSWFTVLGLAYAGYASISTFWSSAPKPSFFVQHFLFLAVWLSGTAWLASRGRLDCEVISKTLVAAGAIASIAYQIVFHYYNLPIGYSGAFGYRLFSENFGAARNPNSLGVLFGITTILAYGRWLHSSGLREGLLRFGLFGLNAVAVVATFSRTAILAQAIVLALYFVFFNGKSRKWITHAVAFIILTASLLIVANQKNFVSAIDARIKQEDFRSAIWSEALKESMNEHFFLGKGLVKTTRLQIPSINQQFNHAHNAFIDAFYWTGIIGLALMVAHMAYVFRHWSNGSELQPLFFWFLFGCLTALFDRPGFFEHLNSSWFAYWIPAGLIGAAVTSKRKTPASP